jgi:hypothetical protein
MTGAGRRTFWSHPGTNAEKLRKSNRCNFFIWLIFLEKVAKNEYCYGNKIQGYPFKEGLNNSVSGMLPA